MWISSDAVRRAIDRERDEAAPSRRKNNDDKSKQEKAFMYEKSHANGQPAMPSGLALLRDPALNRGTGFTEAQRDKFGLRGFLPPHVHSQEEQAVRVLANVRSQMFDPHY
jgi:hypothetical protein